MKPEPARSPVDEIPRLIETLVATERRLVELTAGEVDAVAGSDGRTFVLQRAQEQLRQREAARQRAILNALPAHIALLDAQGLIISVNEAWRRFGRSGGLPDQGQAEGVNYLAICDGAEGPGISDAQAAAAGIRAVLAGTVRDFSFEYPCHSPGAPGWFLLMVTPLENAHVHGAVVMHVDITEQKRAEEAMRESNERFAGAFEQAPIGVALVGPEGRWLRVNRALCQLVGYTETELMARTFQDITHPDDLAMDLDLVRRMLAGEIPSYQIEKRYLHARGPEIAVLLNVSLVHDHQGRPSYFVAQIQDITERRKSRQALQASEKRFRALFDQAAVGVAQLDVATGRYLQVNRRFCEIVGRGADEMEQLTFADITHPQDLAHSREMARQLREGVLREYTQEKRYVQASRADVWASVTVSAMWTAGEPPDSFIVVAQDITGRKQLEGQLRQAHKLEAIGTLAGGIAHDFNNILAAIGGYTELARMKLTDNPAVRGHLDSVILTVKRAADLVRQILAFSREQPLERRLMRLQPVVTECVMLLRATLPPAIQLDLEVAEDAPTVLADETQVLQVLMNLGTNARQALGDRPGRIRVQVENCPVDEAHPAARSGLRPGGYVRVSVSDTGAGMDQETLRRIFEPFFTTKAPGKGTGLGLAVVHGIMDSHDGLITVDSQPGEGAVFRLYFPAHVAEAALLPPPSTGGRGRGERVLLVDDEKLFVELGRMALEELGYAVDAVMQPAAALELVRATPARFALVITDQSMPGMTGLQLAAELRQIRPDLPIVLTTGHSLTTTVERVEAAGVAQLLLKPITVHSLGAAVHAALSRQPLTTHVSNPPY